MNLMPHFESLWMSGRCACGKEWIKFDCAGSTRGNRIGGMYWYSVIDPQMSAFYVNVAPEGWLVVLTK